MNASIVITSYVFNTAAFVKQRRLLRSTVVDALRAAETPRLLPYAAMCGGKVAAGLSLRY
jgi:hypothetical protein